jgi:hypothetical protein
MKKVLAVLLVALVGCSGMLLCDPWRGEVVIKVTQEQIQEKLDEKFPISKRYLVLLNLTLADPKVVLQEGSDRISFEVSALTNVLVNGEDLKGKAQVTAGVRYEPQEGSLLLVEPDVETVVISLLPEEYEGEVIAIADLAAREYLSDYEIYRLDQSDFKQALAKLVVKGVEVEEGVLRIRLGLP